MIYLTVKFPQRKEYIDKHRQLILKLLKNNKNGVRISLKPKHTDRHWWYTGSVIENDLFNLIENDNKIIYVYDDNRCKKLHAKLACNWFGKLKVEHLDENLYDNYDFDDQKSIAKLYRLILGSPYYYFIITN